MANNFKKIERILTLVHEYSDMDDTTKLIADELITMYANDETFVSMLDEQFEYGTAPYEVVESLETLNVILGYRFKYTLRTNDAKEWHIYIRLTGSEQAELNS